MRPTRGPIRHPLGALTLLASLAFGGTRAGADTFAVGSACPHTTIASAVLAAYLTAGDDLIKITQDLTNQSVLLDDFKPSVRGRVTIRGGYSSCADATASGRSVVDGIASAPVFLVRTTVQSQSTVTLENLEVTGAERGVEVTSGGQLTLLNVLIAWNDQGGALVDAGGLLVADFSSQINRNGWQPVLPALGGGIQCVGGALILAGEIDNNRAELGAGLGLTAGCTAELLPGVEISTNYSDAEGGGIYADLGSVVTATEEGGPVRIFNNSGRRGGGIYLAASTFVGVDVAITLNQAELDGGGIHATGGSVVSLTGRPGVCTNPLLGCSGLYQNQIQTAGGDGSAIHADNSAVTLRQMTLQRNQKDSFYIAELQPSLLFAAGGGAELTLENLKIWDNRATQIVEARGGAAVVVGYLTSARNSFVSGASSFPSVIDVVDSATAVGIYSSILWDHGGFYFAGGSPALVVDCAIVSGTTGIPGGSRHVNVVDPLFLDAAAGDLRVPVSSPAVDYCDEAVYPFPGAPDFDGETRGVDHLGNPNGAPGAGGGRFDIGFDELATAVIFSDGFESGSTSAWP